MQRRPATVVISAIVVVALAVIAALALDRGGPGSTNATSASPNASNALAASASPSPTATSTPAGSSSRAAVGVQPDARHGLIVATGNMRTEDDPRGLQQPTLFQPAPTSSYAVSPDGKRVALIRTSQTGQQIVTFTTARPNDVTTVVDLAGSGELANRVVWAGDNSESILFDAVKESRGQGGGDNVIWEYSALRSIDLAKRDVRDVARIATRNTKLWPLAWLPARQLVGALEMESLGPVVNYVIVRNGSVERTAMSPIPIPTPSVASFSASRDGARIVASLSTSIRWWPVDQPSAAKDLPARTGEKLGRAEFRPGADEIGVEVLDGGRLEIWSLTGQRRVVANRVGGFVHWRVDGTAAIASPDPNTVLLVDPVTGATTPLPGGGFLVADVVLF